MIELRSMLSKSFFKLFFSSGAIQLVPLFMIPIYTRIYAVDNIADYGVVFALSLTLSPLITLRLEHALLKINANRLLYKFVIELFFISLVMSAIFAALIVNFSFLFDGHDDLIVYVLVFGALFSNAFFLITINFLVSVSDYDLITKCRVTKVLFEALISVSLGWFFELSFGLVAGYVAGGMISLLYLYIIYNGRLKEKKTNIYIFKFFVKDYVTKDVPSSFLNQMSSNLPVYIMSYFSLNASFIASYAMIIRVINAPSTLIANSVGIMFRGRAQKELKIHGRYLRSFKSATMLALFPAVIVFNILIFSNESIWNFVFGDELTSVATIAKIFAVAASLKIISMSVSYGYYISSALTANLVFQIVNFLVGFTLLFINGIYENLIYSGLMYYAIALSFYYLFFILFGYKLSCGKNSSIFKST